MKPKFSILLSFFLLISLNACIEGLFSENVPLGDAVNATASEEIVNASTVYFVEMDGIPFHIQRFKEVQAQVDNTPQGAAAMFLVALHIYHRYPGEGSKALIASCAGAAVKDANDAKDPLNNFEGKALLDVEYGRIKEQIERYPNLRNAYFKGASPENAYTPNTNPYRIEFPSFQDLGTNLKFFVSTKGADSNRPIRLIKINDKWRVDEYSSVLSGIKDSE